VKTMDARIKAIAETMVRTAIPLLDFIVVLGFLAKETGFTDKIRSEDGGEHANTNN